MLKKTLSIAILSTLSASSAFADFSQTIFFGDSLTDSGAFVGNPDAGAGGKYTTNPGNVWSENLAQYFSTQAIANNPNNPRTDPNGTNYAQGGAQVTNAIGVGTSASPQHALPLKVQLEQYLANHPQADTNALYTLWGGANDVFFQSTLLGQGAVDLNTALDSMKSSALDFATLAQRLTNAGATQILVPLLPDTGQTPSQILVVISTAGKGNPNLSNAIKAATLALTAPAFNTADQQAAKLKAVADAETVLGLPAGSLQSSINNAVQASSALAITYNEALKVALANTSANIIYMDSQTLFRELLADPKNSGFTNVLATACGVPSSLNCTPTELITPIGAEAFLFADGVHPTTNGHKVISDAMISVIKAPSLISTLYNSAKNTLTNNMQYLDQQMATMPAKTAGTNTFFGGITYANNDNTNSVLEGEGQQESFTIGFGRHIADGLFTGVALSSLTNNGDFGGNNGNFDMSGYQASVFLNYQTDMLFARATASVSTSLDFDHIKRKIQLGRGFRVEEGNTEGKFKALSLNMGANLLKTEQLSAGPLFGVHYQDIKVDGYKEDGMRSTAMTFGNQDSSHSFADIGLFVKANFGKGIFNLNLTRRFEINDDNRHFSYNLNTVQNQTLLNNISTDMESWRVDASVSAEIVRNLSVNAGLIYQTDGDAEGESINFGLRYDL